MQTKFNIGDEVKHNSYGWSGPICKAEIESDSTIGYYVNNKGNYGAEENLTLTRPKGCPFKVGDVVVESWYQYDSGFKIEHFETQGDILYAFGEGNNRKARTDKLKLLVTDECPKQSPETLTQINNQELRSILREICSVLKLSDIQLFKELPKIIGTRLEHLATAYAHCDELREVLHLSSSSSIPMIVGAVKELKNLYEQAKKIANENRNSWRKELDGIVQTLKGGTTGVNVDVALLCANRMAQIDELKKRLGQWETAAEKINELINNS